MPSLNSRIVYFFLYAQITLSLFRSVIIARKRLCGIALGNSALRKHDAPRHAFIAAKVIAFCFAVPSDLTYLVRIVAIYRVYFSLNGTAVWFSREFELCLKTKGAEKFSFSAPFYLIYFSLELISLNGDGEALTDVSGEVYIEGKSVAAYRCIDIFGSSYA